MVRQLEIIFNGIACFIPDGDRYRVLFPDGRTPPDASYKIPRHELSVQVRPRAEVPTARWQWSSQMNDYAAGDPVPMTISIGGLNATPIDKSQMVDRLPNLKESDASFVLDPNPKVWGTLMIDRGTLSAHEVEEGSILVKWIVEADDAATIRFTLGTNWLDITRDTKQVVLANTATEDIGSHDSDFLLYRHLATAKTGSLQVKKPGTPPIHGGVTIGQQLNLNFFCPIIDCSNVFLM